jgi:uncharacterized protein
MKKFILFLFCCVVFTTSNSQQSTINPFPKTISVNGSASLEVIPDEIYVNTMLREYQKKGEDKKNLEIIKANFLASCKAVGISDSSISIASYNGYNNYYLMKKSKRKNPDLYSSITYQIKFSSSKQMDELIDKLDDEATQSFDISYTSHSKMTEYRKQLKIQAIKAAKEKATYLSESIGEKLGSAVTITEPQEPEAIFTTENVGLFSQYFSNKSADADKVIEVDFKKLKLRFEVNVIFALQ